MTKEQLADWRAKGFVFDETADQVATDSSDDVAIFSITVLKIKPVKGYAPKFTVRIDCLPYEHRVEVVAQGKVFPTYKSSDITRIMYPWYQADINVEIPILYLSDVFEIKARIVHWLTGKELARKTINVKASEDGTVVQTSEKARNSSDQKPYEAASTDIVTYRIYWNSAEKGRVVKEGNEKTAKAATYIYYDRNGAEHYICSCPLIRTAKMKDDATKYLDAAKKIRITSVPEGYISAFKYPDEGDADIGYVYENGDIVVTPKPNKTNYGIVKYRKGEGEVTLVSMHPGLRYEQNGTIIYYSFSNTMRRYCNPAAYAGFIGALAELGRKDIQCTGMCFADATSYPSTTHPNGDSADTLYFKTLGDEQKKVDAFRKFNFTKIYRGQTEFYSKLKGTSYKNGHESHLHAGEFRLTDR